MQRFNSGTIAWFAWAAACLSVIRTHSNSQRTGSWRSLPTRKHSQACASEKEQESSLCAMAWFILWAVLHHDKAGTFLSYMRKQDTTACTTTKIAQVNILIVACLWEMFSVQVHSCNSLGLICAYNTGIFSLNGMTHASLYIYFCTFPALAVKCCTCNWPRFIYCASMNYSCIWLVSGLIIAHLGINVRAGETNSLFIL